MTPDQFVASLRTYLGARAWHKGRDHFGVDCVGLLVCAIRDLGEEVYDRLDYQRHVRADVLRQGLLASCREVGVDDLARGDVLLFRSRDGNAQHVAVLTETEPATIIHSWDVAGRVIEHPLSPGLRRALAGVFRWRDW